VVGVPVPLVVHRHDVHQHDVLGVLVHAGERDPDGGEHPPDGEEGIIGILQVYYYRDTIVNFITIITVVILSFIVVSISIYVSLPY